MAKNEYISDHRRRNHGFSGCSCTRNNQAVCAVPVQAISRAAESIDF